MLRHSAVDKPRLPDPEALALNHHVRQPHGDAKAGDGEQDGKKRESLETPLSVCLWLKSSIEFCSENLLRRSIRGSQVQCLGGELWLAQAPHTVPEFKQDLKKAAFRDQGYSYSAHCYHLENLEKPRCPGPLALPLPKPRKSESPKIWNSGICIL